MPFPQTPYIPQYITVHLAAPDTPAENVTVSFQDYIKNVASSEIYPTWEESAIYANIYAQISYALNRVYTEFYPSRGYDFNITSSTAYDQKFINGRAIFENIDRIVDEIFTTYIRRIGFIEPLAAKYCNGTTVTCEGLSQWGSQYLARQGYNSVRILKYYYGDNIELVKNAPISEIKSLYPGTPVKRGDRGNDVLTIQTQLNRIAVDYPAIPSITPDGIFGESTENAVMAFQRIFNLTADGIVGPGTWNKMTVLYYGLLRLSELNSEGLQYVGYSLQFPGNLELGDTGRSVQILQYFLSVVAEFYDSIPSVSVTGEFGQKTKTAVQAFQYTFGLNPDGIVGPMTWEELYSAYQGISNTILIPDSSILSFPGDNVALGALDYE